MVQGREMISSPAHDAIVDGDDLYIGESFEDEENFSTVGNASCHTHQRSVLALNKPTLKKSPSPDKKNIDIDDDGKNSKIFYKKSRKVMKKLRRMGQSSRLLSIRVLQRSSLFRSSSNTVSDYEEVMENEFGLEEEDDFARESGTIISLRSSRNNVRTGQSMLVRQQAQVISRPSKASSNWELSPSNHSSPKNYRNMMLRGKSLILDDASIGGMSDITEDASTFYGFSNLNHLSFRRTPMFINTNTYCINEGEDEDEDENGNENGNEESDGGSCDESLKRAYDFRELSPSDDRTQPVSKEISPILESPGNSQNEGTRLSLHDRMRRRAYSDSDIESDIHQNVSNTNPQPSNIFPWNLTTTFKNHVQSQIDFHRRKSLPDKSYDCEPLSNSYHDDKSSRKEGAPQKTSSNTSRFVAAAYASWPFPKTRIHSDPDIGNVPTDDELRSPRKGFSDGIEIENVDHLDTKPEMVLSEAYNALALEVSCMYRSSRRQSLPMFERNEQNNRSFLRSRTYSDSVIHDRSAQEDILCDLRCHLEVDDEAIMVSSTKCSGGARQIFEINESPIASERRYHNSPQTLDHEHPSPSNEIVDHSNHRPAASSMLTTLSHTNDQITNILVSVENQKSLQKPSIERPSPRTLNAATMIAAALRPAPATRMPALPTKSPSTLAERSDQYYWGARDARFSTDNGNNDCREDRSLQLKDLCSWSSESFDDDIF